VVITLQVGNHTGGYDAFYFDITDALTHGSSVEVIVGVFDPSDLGTQPFGLSSSCSVVSLTRVRETVHLPDCITRWRHIHAKLRHLADCVRCFWCVLRMTEQVGGERRC
jgi:hypothetical protein